MPVSCRSAPVASWMSRWLVNFRTLPMIAGQDGHVDHARGDLPLDPPAHEDELDHLVAAVLHLLEDQVDRRVHLGAVDLFPGRHRGGDVLVLVDGAQVRVEVVLVAGRKVAEAGEVEPRAPASGASRRRACRRSAPTRSPIASGGRCPSGGSGSRRDEHVVPVHVDRLVELHPVAEVAGLDDLHSSPLPGPSQAADENEEAAR